MNYTFNASHQVPGDVQHSRMALLPTSNENANNVSIRNAEQALYQCQRFQANIFCADEYSQNKYAGWNALS